MKIGVLGAGISGLSFARIAKKFFEVEVLEAKSIHGGIARTKNVDGVAYHPTGGHCFNSKYKEVLEFVFNEVLPKDQWHLVNRSAVIDLYGNEISYPIEYSVKEIFKFNPDLALNIARDFLNTTDSGEYRNLEEWFRKKFGNTLAEVYFIPYNAKIWNKKPNEMRPDWVEGKLPIPDKLSFFKGLIENESDSMPHSSFYYPNSNNQNTFVDALASGLDIVYDYPVSTIDYKSNKWEVNLQKQYDILVNTLPLNTFPSLFSNIPDIVLQASRQLKYNKVTTMFWETTGTDNTWTYIPNDKNIFHRYIHIGNFFSPKKNYSITEAVGKRTYDEMVENGRKDPFLVRPIDYHVSEHAYVIFDENYSSSKKVVRDFLNSKDIYTLGRFGEWEYYNMDICIKKSIELFDIIFKRYK